MNTASIAIEVQRTRPDYYAFIPPSLDRTTGTTGNEHFLVERLANGHLFAVWTQSSIEGAEDQRIVFSRSLSGGENWSPPRTIAQCGEGKGMASWAFPIVSPNGRIYIIFNRHIGINDIFTHTTGMMACLYSDDEGESWSQETILEMPRSIWDNPDPRVPPNWIVWQKPIRLQDGRFLVGMTRWVSPKVLKGPMPNWWATPSMVEFIRFENIHQTPKPEHLRISFLASDQQALKVGLREHPETPVLQEPSIIPLPDGRLFCIMRTTLGSPFYSISTNQGENWSSPRLLRQHDGGAALLHPLSPCPIYPVDDLTYAFFYHNHDGRFLNWTFADTSHHRRPICLAKGEFRPDAEQPIWFSQPWFFMDHGGIPLLRTDMAMYASTTPTKEGIILWYPDRKFFLLGKKISHAELASLSVKNPE